MLTKKILFIWFLWVSLLTFWYAQNSGLPLGYDHGAYKHLINLLAENNDIGALPTYLQYQFEPFSGTFFYSLTTWVGKEMLFGWWYLCIFILTSVALFLLWKKKKKYTLGSYLGLFLFLFSSIQYMNFWWAFGKQMFATFFLILLMRYPRKGFIAFLLITTCISLHRLTGFIALSYFAISYLVSQKKSIKQYYSTLIGMCAGFLSYIALFHEQVFPYIKNFITSPEKQILIDGKYGTGFSGGELFFYLVPILLMVILWSITLISQKSTKNLLRLPAAAFALLLGILVVFRFIAHTRLWTFLDLFLIIIITRYLYTFFHRKWIYIFLIIQCIVWWTFVSKWHTPFVDQTEYRIIQDITHDMPENISLVTLSWAYMSWITGYTNREIYSPRQWIWQNIWSFSERKSMKNTPQVLCNNLSKLTWNVILYIWAREQYASLMNNTCIKEVKKWENGTKLFLYQR